MEMEKEQIINSVFNRRAIWNQSHPDHRNRYILDRLWAEVAEECQSTGRLRSLSCLLFIKYITKVNKIC